MSGDDSKYRKALASRVRNLQPYPEGKFAGNGIVICAGGPALFTNAFVLVHVLRNSLRCRLPIEVWYFGRLELSQRMASLLHRMDVRTVDATDELAKQPAAIQDGWQLKVYALMASAFEQALLLDADIIPTRDPACVFEWAKFKETGAVLWPDLVDLVAASQVWRACGLAPRTVPSIESGQVLIDKAKCWSALQATLHLNECAEHYYRLVYGDKDTWLLGFLLTQSPYSLVPQRPVADGSWCFYQRDFDGAIIFQHRTRAKWRYSGAQDDLPGFVGLEGCLDALLALRRDWNGIVFNAPERNSDALRLDAQLARLSRFSFLVPGHSPEKLQLLADGEIGFGSNSDRRNWYCEVEADEVRLIICDAFGPRWRFNRDIDGRWSGNSLIDPTIEAYLAADLGIGEPSEGPRSYVNPQWPGHHSYSSREEAGA
jgi:hypothetical protein